MSPKSSSSAKRRVRSDLGGNPFVLDIVRHGVGGAKAIIVLMTPDERAYLDPGLKLTTDGAEAIARWQPRPNVIYEVGLSMGLNPGSTILVSLGNIGMYSDLNGVHVIRLDNSVQSRHMLRDAILGAGCDMIDVSDRIAWLEPEQGGDFGSCLKPASKHRDPFRDN
jgi:predicted nucleotide-binding protein